MFDYIKKTYKVPADLNREILFENKRKGIIVEDLGNYIGVNFYDKKPRVVESLHPVWNVKYLEIGQARKLTPGQIRYRNYLKSECCETFIEWLKMYH